MKHIFKDLADPDFLQNCLHNATQNANECVNSIIWTRLPKNAFVQQNILRFGVYEAITTFNKGNITKCLIFNRFGMRVGDNCVAAMKKKDLDRIEKAECEID